MCEYGEVTTVARSTTEEIFKDLVHTRLELLLLAQSGLLFLCYVRLFAGFCKFFLNAANVLGTSSVLRESNVFKLWGCTVVPTEEEH